MKCKSPFSAACSAFTGRRFSFVFPFTSSYTIVDLNGSSMTNHLRFTAAFSKMLSLLALIILFGVLPFRAMAQFVVQYPTGAQSMTACLNPSLLTVRVDVGVATTDNNVVTLTLPPGVTYVPGSVTKTGGTAALTIADLGGTPSAPTFQLGPNTLTAGNFIIFTVQRQAGCASRTHALGGGTFKDNVSVTGTAGTTVENDPAVNPYNVNFPSLSFAQPAAVNNTVVGSSYNRTFSITNGADGCADEVNFYIVYPGGGLTLNSLTLTGFGAVTPASTSGDTLFFTISGVGALTADGLFCNGESLQFTENFRVNICNASTQYRAGWGCSASPSAWCQTASGSGTITMANGVPNVRYTSHVVTQRPDFCDNMILEATITNIATETVPGSATAFSLLQRFGHDGGEAINFRTPLSATNFELSDGAGGWIPLVHTQGTPGTPANVFLNQLTTNPGATAGLVDADGDGQFDDLPAGASFRIRYTVVVPCQQSCNSQSLSGQATAQTTFNNQCGVQTLGTKLTMSGTGTNGTIIEDRAPNSVTFSGPSDINDGETVVLRLDGTKSFYNSSGFAFDCPTNQLVLRVAVPKGISLASGLYFQNGTLNGVTNTVSTSTIIGTTHDTLVVVGTGTLNYTNYSFEIGLSLDCSVYTGGAITYTIHYQCDAANTCGCQPVWRCGTVPLLAHCPSPCPEGGLTPHLSQLTRTTSGYANPYAYNTNTFADINTLSLAQRKIALPYDTIVGQINGTMVPNTTGATITGHFYEMSYNLLGGNPVFAAHGANVTVKNFITGVSQSCFIAAPSSNTTTGGIHRVTYNLSSCGIPINDNDSVFVAPIYSVLNNTSLPNVPAPLNGLTVRMYSTTTVAGEQFTCDTYSAQMNVHRLTASRFDGTGPIVKLGCGTGGYSSIFYNNSTVLYDLYPGEVRSMMYIDSIRINVGSNDQVTGNINLRSFGLITDGYPTNAGVVTNITPFATFSNNNSVVTIVNDGSWPLGEHSNGSGNMGYNLTFNVANGCQSLSSGNIEVRYFYKEFAYAQNPTVKNDVVSLSSRQTTNVLPSIALTDQTGLVQAAAPTESWVVRISNPTTHAAPFTWLAIPSDPNITVVGVVDLTTMMAIPSIPYPGGVWYQLSAAGVPAAGQGNYRIDFNYTSCTLDTLGVLAGWNCGSFPTDPTSYVCNAQTLNLRFDPVISEVELIPVSVPAGTVDLCVPASYQYNVNCSQAGNTVNNTFSLTVPQGMFPVAGTVQAEYPAGAANWASVPFTLSGNTYTYDLTAHPAYPAATGLPGTLNAASNAERQIGVRWQVQTDCNFIANSNFIVATGANRPCGQPAIGNSLPIQGPPVGITGVSPAYFTVNGLATDTLTNCQNTTTIEFNTIIVAGSTGSTGIINIDLPSGLTYIAGSLACTSAFCPTFLSVNTLPGDIDRVQLSIPSGMNSGDFMDYSIEVDDEAGASCGVRNITLRTLDQVSGVACPTIVPSGVCPTLTVATGNGNVNLVIQKPSLILNSVNAGVTVYTPDNEYNAEVTVNNTGILDQIAANPVTVEFYCADALGNATGAPISTFVMAGTIPAGGTLTETHTFTYNSCDIPNGIVTVLSQNNNCLCAPSELRSFLNEVPEANDDYAVTTEDTPVSVNVVFNDTDNDGNIDPTTVTVLSGPSNGTATVDPLTGVITYIPALNFNGNDTLLYQVCDDGTPLPSQCDTAYVFFTVLPANDVPVANPDAAVTPEDTPVAINVISNDTDSDGNINPVTVQVINGPANGSVTVDPVTGVVTYTPSANFNGTDTFIYQVCDDGTPLPAQCDTSIVTITVTPVNDAPVAVNDNASTPEDTPVVINVPGNDTDVDGNLDLTSVTIVTGPTNGTVTVDPVTGAVTYTPNADFNGTDVFTYNICDTGLPVLCDTATVTINVVPVNDPPVIDLPDPTTPEDTPVTICSPITDPDMNQTFTATLCGGPYNGTVSGPTVFNGQVCVTYTPNPNYNGLDSICVIVCDQGGLCDTSTTVITVTPVNDPPVAVDDNATTPEDTPISSTVVPNDSDVDGPGATYTLVNNTSNGTLVLNTDGTYTYTPNANFSGTDTFTYSLCDGGTPNLCDTAVVTITVIPVNDPPVIDLPDPTTPEDTPVTVCSPITDPDMNQTFTAGLCGGPYNGTVSGPTVFNGQVCVTYTPNPNYNGLDSICVIVCDQGGLCDTSTTVITVTPVNDPPVANDDFATTNEDVPVVIGVLSNDTDIDGNLVPTSVSVITGPNHGTTTVNPSTGEITYTPDPTYYGMDTLTYVVCDDGTPLPSLCDTAVVYISVAGVNNPPVANADNATTPEDTPVTVNVVSNDTDIDGNIVNNSVSIVNNPSNGSVFVNPLTGEITYTPNPNFNGVDTFIYLVCDDGTPLPSLCDTAVVTITVTPVNDPPVAVNDFANTPEDTPVVINVPGNDTDVDGNLDLTSVSIVSGPTNGTVTVDPVTGTVTYTPNANYNGPDVFTYNICDTGLPVLCDTAVVTINVSPVNDPPVIDLPDPTTPEDTPVTVCSPITDPDMNQVYTATLCGGPYNGTVSGPTVFNGQVCVTYTPNPNYNGLDSICVIVCDQGGLCDTSTTVITVTPVNDPPVANDDNASTPEDTPVVINVPGNDTDVDGNLDLTSVSIVSGPTNGTVTVDPVTGTVTYTPNANYNGPDVFTYNICDTGLPVLCDTAVVTINVSPVNDPPVIDLPDPTTPEDTPVTVCSPITDPDMNQVYTATLCGGPYNGTVSGPTVFNGQVCVTYTPNPNYNGLDSICVIVCDQGGLCDTSTTVITVTPVNDPPVANDDNASTPEDTPVVINVPGNDTDVDGNLDLTSVSIVSGPTNGTVTVDPVTGTVTYTPNANYNGPDVFTYNICDTGLPVFCDTAVVTINVSPVNDPPVIDLPDPTTPEDTPVTVCSPITDPDMNQVYTATLCGGPYNGTVSGPTVFNGQVCVTYTPNPNYNGLDSICVIVCDQGGLCDTSTTVITVTPVNDPPVAVNDTVTTTTGNPVTVPVTGNDSDIDGNIDPTTVTIVSGPAPGSTVTVDPVTGEITYTPGANVCGMDSFTYTVCDDGTPLPSLCDTATVFITIQDTEAPQVVCPVSPSTFNSAATQCGYTVTGTALDATATDNCGSVTLAHNYYAWGNPNSLAGATFPVGTTTVVWTATDESGNSSTCTVDVVVADSIAPQFANCPSGVTYTLSLFPDDCQGSAIWPIPFAVDNCTSVSVLQTSGPAPGSILPVGFYAIEYTARDIAGNETVCAFALNIIDTEHPTITCPGNIVTVNADPGVCTWTSPVHSLTPLLVTSNCAATVAWSALNPDGSTLTGTDDISGYVFDNGTTTVTYTVTETASGQNWSCSFTVTVIDNQAPVIAGCVSDMTVANDAGVCGAVVNWTPPTATDNCTLVSFTSTHNPGDLFPIGTTTVTYTATDSVGHVSVCSFDITVTDSEAPTITGCPTNISVSNDPGGCGAAVSWAVPVAGDNCAGVTMTATHTPGTVFPVGTTTVTYIATDAAGLKDTCSFTVTVTDTEAPTITNCPSNITVNNAYNQCEKSVNWMLPTITDNCSGLVVTSTHTPGMTFPIGTTTVTYTATDASGNVSVCSFTVTVNDTQAPAIFGCPSNITLNNSPGICGATATWTVPSVSDNCPGSTLTGTHAPNTVFPVGTTTVTYTATDASMNTTVCTFQVTVVDTEWPVISNGPGNITQPNDAGNCSAAVSWTAPTATDNCTLLSFTSSHNPGDVFPVGTTAVTYTATDSVGHVSTHTFNVTVVDAEMPAVTGCPANIIVANDSADCFAVVSWVAPSATDNCGNVTVTSTHNPGDTFPIGTTEVVYTFTDAAGNVSTCTFTVTVDDTQIPFTVSCPSDINSCVEFITWDVPVFDDNCTNNLSITSNYTPGSNFLVGSTTVVYTATDAMGNTATCQFVVTRSAISISPVFENISCYGFNDGSATVIVRDAIQPLGFQWTPGGLTDSLLTNLSPGDYTVTVTDGIGCMASDTITITQPDLLELKLVELKVSGCGLSTGYVEVEATGGTPEYAYTWSNQAQGSILYNVPSATYDAYVVDNNGCTDTLSVTVGCEFVDIPQLVTPNGDGHNDTWIIPGIDQYPDATVEIYNRWGNLVYKSQPYNNDWDGHSDGLLTLGKERLPAGTYFYVVILNKGDKAKTGYLELQY